MTQTILRPQELEELAHFAREFSTASDTLGDDFEVTVEVTNAGRTVGTINEDGELILND